jgi:hypothetical protein
MSDPVPAGARLDVRLVEEARNWLSSQVRAIGTAREELSQ